MRSSFRLALVVLVAWLGGSPAPALAQVTGRQLSPYEAESLRKAVDAVDGEIDHDAEGKIIEDVEVVPLEVFEERDPAPSFLNWFHTTTQARIVNREVLMRVGGPFTRRLADETERNLRNFPQLSVVLVAPLRGSEPNRVRLLVVVKDVWSLRLNWEPEFVNASLRYLSLEPQESNVFGTSNTILGKATFTAQNVTLGGGLVIPRIANSRIRATLVANAIVRCGGPASGTLEGTDGFFNYGQPLYSTLAKWAWGTQINWSRGINRPTARQLGASVCSGADSPLYTHEPTGEQFPDQYRAESLRGVFNVVRSFGRVFKTNVNVGIEATQTLYSTDFPDISPEATAAYSALRLPRNDQRISPYVEIQSFETNFQRTINVDTLGLQEDFRIGHFAGLKVYPAAQALGSRRDMLGVIATASYHLPILSGFAFAMLRSFTEFSDYDAAPLDAEGKPLNDRRHGELNGVFRVVSPKLGFGRFLHGGQFTARYLNHFYNSASALGSSCVGSSIGQRQIDGSNYFDHCDRMRGYRTSSIYGSNFLVYNMEFRTPPIQIYSVVLGLAFFYDIGDAFYDVRQIDLKSGAGAGIRLGFPQLNYNVFRIDAAFPLGNENVSTSFTPTCDAGVCTGRVRPDGEITILAGFGQAF